MADADCGICGPICIKEQADGSFIVRKDGRAVRAKAEDIKKLGKVRAIREALELIKDAEHSHG